MRARIAERLKEAQNTAASLTTFNEIDMSALMAFRAKYKDQVLKDHGVKLGFMSAFVKASTVALRELPAVNASIEGNEMVYRDYADVSVAVSTPKGLVTPVLRNAEGFNFVEIEREIANLGKKARDGKLTLEDMNGGTFTMCVASLCTLCCGFFRWVRREVRPDWSGGRGGAPKSSGRESRGAALLAARQPSLVRRSVPLRRGAEDEDATSGRRQPARIGSGRLPGVLRRFGRR